jgi:hypothetical protein
MTPTEIYRGDSISKGSLVQSYRSAGLLTKLVNGGNPAYVSKHGLLESVRAHVKANNESEEFFQKRSQFFSFSEKKDVAAFYASSKQPSELTRIRSDDCSETRYIFTLIIRGMVGIERQKGLYSIQYACDPRLIRGDSPLDEKIGYDPLAAMYKVIGLPCEVCGNKRLGHRLLLIDVVAFLRAVPSAARFAGSLANAKKDSEWLVMPADYVPHLYGDSARIPRSQIWFAEHYRLRSESPRGSSIQVGGSDVAGFE